MQLWDKHLASSWHENEAEHEKAPSEDDKAVIDMINRAQKESTPVHPAQPPDIDDLHFSHVSRLIIPKKGKWVRCSARNSQGWLSSGLRVFPPSVRASRADAVGDGQAQPAADRGADHQERHSLFPLTEARSYSARSSISASNRATICATGLQHCSRGWWILEALWLAQSSSLAGYVPFGGSGADGDHEDASPDAGPDHAALHAPRSQQHREAQGRFLEGIRMAKPGLALVQ